MKTNKLALIGILTALYVVLSTFMKIPVIGNISLDLGYIALSIACGLVGPWAGFVGAVGCGLESILFSSYGFSISWFVANLFIGFMCGYLFKCTSNKIIRIAYSVFAVLFAVGVVKTGIECTLYSIPVLVKIPKNFTAFVMDSICMIIGLYILPRIQKVVNK